VFLAALNRELPQWERMYNTVRTYQDLGCLTPQQFMLRCAFHERSEHHLLEGHLTMVRHWINLEVFSELIG
jgi:hypothetical protein